jgi:hypothetical protein
MPTSEEVLSDIRKRNAGDPVVSVWNDGTFVVHGRRDAEQAWRCEPDKVILTLDLTSWTAIQFIGAQEATKLAEKLFGRPNLRH